MAGEAAVGEFEDVLRAQVAEARATVQAARAARDFEALTPAVLRLRYLLAIAEDNGVEIGDQDAGGAAPPVATGEG